MEEPMAPCLVRPAPMSYSRPMSYPPAQWIGRRCPAVRGRRSHVAAIAVAFTLLPLAGAPDTSAASGALPRTGPADAATPARMRLISQEQYFNSLAYVFGPDIPVAAHFAPFRRTDGLLANGSASAGVTISQMQEFQRAAGSPSGRRPRQPRLPGSVHAARRRRRRSLLCAQVPATGRPPAVPASAR